MSAGATADARDRILEAACDMLAAEGSVTVSGPDGERSIAAADLFQDLMETSVAQGEVVTEVRMPAMDGLAATREIKREHPDIVVLIMTMHENTDYLLEALDAGAAGYVLKDSPAERLISAVRRTLKGESPLNQELAARLLRRLAEERRNEPAPKRPEPRESLREPLTPRELEVLRLLATGRTNQQIAQILVIHGRTSLT